LQSWPEKANGRISRDERQRLRRIREGPQSTEAV